MAPAVVPPFAGGFARGTGRFVQEIFASLLQAAFSVLLIASLPKEPAGEIEIA